MKLTCTMHNVLSAPNRHVDTRFCGQPSLKYVSDDFHTGDQLYQFQLTHDPDPYIGRVPRILKETHPHASQALDELAQALRKIRPYQPQCLKMQLADRTVQLKHIGDGAYGTVYQFNIGRKQYAFKVFHLEETPDGRGSCNGAYPETSSSFFLKAQGANNIARSKSANPGKGWMLMEWLDWRSYFMRREGRPYQDILSEHGLKYDDERPENYTYGKLNDFGGINNPKTRVVGKGLIGGPTPVEIAGFHQLPPAQRKSYFDRYFAQAPLRPHLPETLKFMTPGEQKEAFTTLMAYPEYRAATTRQIPFLHKRMQREFFEQALAHPESRPVVVVKLKQSDLGRSDRKAVERLIEQYDDLIPTRIQEGESHLLAPWLNRQCPTWQNMRPGFYIPLVSTFLRLAG